jgi:hypothetical protein
VGDNCPVKRGLVQFYENSLLAGEPMVADSIICPNELEVPNYLKRIAWNDGNNDWFLFNSRTGLLTDKWWHIFGCFNDA